MIGSRRTISAYIFVPLLLLAACDRKVTVCEGLVECGFEDDVDECTDSLADREEAGCDGAIDGAVDEAEEGDCDGLRNWISVWRPYCTP